MVYILLGEGFEEIEAIAPCDILRRGGVDVNYAGIAGLSVTGGQGITVTADIKLEEIDLDSAQMLIIPGGGGGVNSILASSKALEIIKETYNRDITLASICAGPTILAHLGLMEGRDAICYPGCEADMGNANIIEGVNVVETEKIITGKAPGASIDFGLALLKFLKGKDIANKVRADLCYDR